MPETRSTPPPVRAALLIDAPAQRVHAAVVSTRTWRRAATAGGWTLAPVPAAQVAETSSPSIDANRWPDGLAAPQIWRVCHRVELAVQDSAAPELLRLAGTGRSRGWQVRVTGADTPAGTLVTVDVRAPLRRWSARARLLRTAQWWLGLVLLEATDAAGASSSGPRAMITPTGERQALGGDSGICEHSAERDNAGR